MAIRTEPTLPSEASAPRVLDVELLALDLSLCTRCVGTVANIEAAVAAVRQVLEVTGASVRLRKILIDSEELARRHRFTSSPTIRIDGRDIVFETLESRCDSCTDLCGCDEGTSCRVWRYQGREYTEAPVGLVTEALLRGILGGAAAAGAAAGDEGDEVPENLRRLFSAKAARRGPEADSCCSSSEQAACCEPAQKDACGGGPEPASCGCR